MADNDKKPGVLPKEIGCLVIGGCANGVLLPSIRADAQLFELKRPAGIKPLASSLQQNPELINESDVYEMHVLGLTNTGGVETAYPETALFALAVVDGTSLTEGFKRMVAGYIQHVADDYAAKNLITKH